MLVTENQLDQWVAANERDAQGTIVELVWRLVAASCPKPRKRRFPLGDSIGQPGPDGELDVGLGLDPFVPAGLSYWEIGTGSDPASKATRDYRGLLESLPSSIRETATFVFVTPRSGTRGWGYTWKDRAQARWLEERSGSGEWKDVRIIDGTVLVDWLARFPAVAIWLLQRIAGVPPSQIELPELRWKATRSAGSPPALSTQVLLTGREEARGKIDEVLAGNLKWVKLDTLHPNQIADFVSAHLAELEDEGRVEALGRCVIVSGRNAWHAIIGEQERHILVAAPQLDLGVDTGENLISEAVSGGHGIIFGGPPVSSPNGGATDGAAVPLPNLTVHDIREALEKSGYGEERARALALRSGGNPESLLRSLRGLPLLPEWAEGAVADDLIKALLLGGWEESAAADSAAVQDMIGPAYEEWIVRLRGIVLGPNAPITQRDGRWKFALRFDGWYALGRRIYDEQIDRISRLAIAVLGEEDPRLELAKGERFAAALYGKARRHSSRLREGLADTLALLGSHSDALTSCSTGKPRAAAAYVARTLLDDAEWVRWASLDDVLPLLAEAAPRELLDCLEGALSTRPETFMALFAQEGDGITGGAYMTGLLWALETIAWDRTHFSKAVMCLAALAKLDPGGRWGNRPASSLYTIFLPWLPQTCATVKQRESVLRVVLREYPDVGWKLLQSLLPDVNSWSSQCRRPTWRPTIPVDWKFGVSPDEYVQQVAVYSELLTDVAIKDLRKAVDMLSHWERLPVATRDALHSHISSNAILGLPENERNALWDKLVDVVTKHRRFQDARWAMPPDEVERLAVAAERLAPESPSLRHLRLFSNRELDLYEERGDYEEQHRRLEVKRREAVSEIALYGGASAVLAFAMGVKSPGQVGFAFGEVADEHEDAVLLPAALKSSDAATEQLIVGFVRGRLARRGWTWADAVLAESWSPEHVATLLCYLPFSKECWDRVDALLGKDNAAYWDRVQPRPYETEATDALRAVQHLLKAGRAGAAIPLLHLMNRKNQPADSALVVSVLLATANSLTESSGLDLDEVTDVIRELQNDPHASIDGVRRVEWSWLPLLNDYHGASPKHLERRLATDPSFFCEVVRVVYPREDGSVAKEVASPQSKNIATNAYRLLARWRTPPGCRDDGAFDGQLLRSWVHAVGVEASASGHIDESMRALGRVLIHVPADPDGLWIDRSAAELLDNGTSAAMRRGFIHGIRGSRGYHWVDPTGKAELELAATYRSKADALEVAGYPRLAMDVRDIATCYEREAERNRMDPRFRD